LVTKEVVLDHHNNISSQKKEGDDKINGKHLDNIYNHTNKIIEEDEIYDEIININLSKIQIKSKNHTFGNK